MRLSFFLMSVSAFAQNLSVGFVAGTSPTADFQNEFAIGTPGPGFTNYSTPKRYIVGATLEYRFTPRFSIEADGLYHPLGYTFAGVEPDGSLNSISPATVVTWEFPVLAKYRFPFRGVSPFIEAGPSFRTAGNLNSADPSHVGVTGGIGLETRFHDLSIAPAIRYTRWEADPEHVVKTVSNQVEILVAFTSAPKSNWHPMGSRIALGGIVGVNLLGDFRPRDDRFTIDDLNSGNIFSADFTQRSGPRSFQGGGSIELSLTRDFSVEADMIYEKLKSRLSTLVLGTPPPNTFLPGNYVASYPEWKFPVLAKYRVHRARWSPVAELGPTFRLPPGAETLSAFGATAGLGIESHWRRLKISPVLRYTRWAPESSPEFTRGNRNQLDLLTGFSF